MNLIKEKSALAVICSKLPDSYSITSQDEELRNDMASRAASVIAVTNANQQELARLSAVEIRRHCKEVEAMRVTLTEPLLRGQRLIKALADDYCAPLKIELGRLEKLATDFQQQEQRRVQEAERIQRLEIERLDKERKALEEKAAFLAAKPINTNAQLAKAIQAEEVATVAAERLQAVYSAPLPEVRKSKGQSMRQKLKWTVTDLRALAMDRFDLVRCEPNAAGIQATCVPGMPNQPKGLHLEWEEKVTFNSR